MIIWGSSNVDSGKLRGAAELSWVQVEVFSANESEELLLWESLCSSILYNIADFLSRGANVYNTLSTAFCRPRKYGFLTKICGEYRHTVFSVVQAFEPKNPGEQNQIRDISRNSPKNQGGGAF